jgi:hypothetical protein
LDQIINLTRRTAVKLVFIGKVHQFPVVHLGGASIHWTKSSISRGTPWASQYSLDQVINLPWRTAGKPVFTLPSHQSPAAHCGQASTHWTKSSIARNKLRVSQYSLDQNINRPQ